MTRRDFQTIAATLRDERPESAINPTSWQSGTFDQWATTVLAFAKMCSDNANYDRNGNNVFDREHFLRACHYA
jgi:hypothetical protein